MSTLREEIVSEIAFCEKEIKQDDIEIAVWEERKKIHFDQKAMLIGMLELYDAEHPFQLNGGDSDA